MANRIKGITVEIGGDTTGLNKALKSVNSSITKTQSALNDVNRLLKLDPSNTVLVAQKQELLSQAIGQTEQKLSALEAAQEQVAAAFKRGDIGADKYQAFQREIEETRGKLNKYKTDLSSLQTEQDSLSTNTSRLQKLFDATGKDVDDYADALGSKLVSAIKSGTASSDQLKSAIDKIGKAATGGKADVKQLTDAIDTVDDGQAIRNLINDLNQAGDAAENTAGDVNQIAEATKGAALMQAAEQLSAVGDTAIYLYPAVRINLLTAATYLLFPRFMSATCQRLQAHTSAIQGADAAIEAILNAADGTPRYINKLCTSCLLIGGTDNANIITADIAMKSINDCVLG